MDPRYTAQDVLRCTLCQSSAAPMHCEVCHAYLCKDCVGKHLSDSSKTHKVVPLAQYCATIKYPKCKKHPNRQCELHCKQCDIPICAQCLSGAHVGHMPGDIFEMFECKKEYLKRQLEELETNVFPKYIEVASNIPVQRNDIHNNTQKLATAIAKHGEDLHREIDNYIQKLKSELDEMDNKVLEVLNKQEDEIKQTMSEMIQRIADLKKVIDSNDIGLVAACKSKNAEFRRLLPKVTVVFPKFTPLMIDTDKLCQQFGALSGSPVNIEEQIYTRASLSAESSPLDTLLNVPRLITSMNTEFANHYSLRSVSCLNDEDLWTCGRDKIMRLYNLQGKLVKSVQTKSGNEPSDIAVTMDGDLVYTDRADRSVNIVKNTWFLTQIQPVIRLQGWKPRSVCSSSSRDLLVVIESDDYKQTKVVRYSGSTEKQTVQFNDKGLPLYSPTGIKYITENRNLDICVSDSGAGAVVVVNQAGKIRFIYTGPPSASKKSLYPYGIATDSQSKILTTDYRNHRIHILDQDGQFLRYISNCDIHNPWGLCVDSNDNLFVADDSSGSLKKIQYKPIL